MSNSYYNLSSTPAISRSVPANDWTTQPQGHTRSQEASVRQGSVRENTYTHAAGDLTLNSATVISKGTGLMLPPGSATRSTTRTNADPRSVHESDATATPSFQSIPTTRPAEPAALAV